MHRDIKTGSFWVFFRWKNYKNLENSCDLQPIVACVLHYKVTDSVVEKTDTKSQGYLNANDDIDIYLLYTSCYIVLQ